jgi:hypothetical protein
MPNFAAFIAEGDFKPLQTTMPPLSPTAWATFITGLDPGGHGVFDFIHREAATMEPGMALSRASAVARFDVGSFSFPIEGGNVELLRRGTAFWNVLENHGFRPLSPRFPRTFRPRNPPANRSRVWAPRYSRHPGTFSYFTNRMPRNARDISGGEVYPVEVRDYRVEAELIGPDNSFRREEVKRGSSVTYRNPKMTIPFTVYIDPNANAAKFEVGKEEFVLQQGEWSEWIPLEFRALGPLVTVKSIARFYMQEVRPDFKLYVSPMQISPESPAMPISTPSNWSNQLFDKLGLFLYAGAARRHEGPLGEHFLGSRVPGSVKTCLRRTASRPRVSPRRVQRGTALFLLLFPRSELPHALALCRRSTPRLRARGASAR